MRRAQKTHTWQRKQTAVSGGLWYPPSYAPDPVQGPTPLAHKLIRVLKRLAKGNHFIQRGYATGRRVYQWVTNGYTSGMLRAKLVDQLKNFGYIVNIGGTWCITSAGVLALPAGTLTTAQKLARGVDNRLGKVAA